MNKNNNIYEKIKAIEDRLTFLYEMRIPNFNKLSCDVSKTSHLVLQVVNDKPARVRKSKQH